MNITIDGLNLIKQFEGCKLKAYKCPAGILTIGYGHTGPDVKEGMAITQLKADELLKTDLKKFESAINKLVKSNINNNQYDSLVSFTYNVGEGALKSSTLLRKVNINPDDTSIKTEFLKWNKAGGKILTGLTLRRQAEAANYFKEVPKVIIPKKPKAVVKKISSVLEKNNVCEKPCITVSNIFKK